MSPLKQELIAAIEVAPDEAIAQTLLFLKTLTNAKNQSTSSNPSSKLDQFSAFLQSEGCYEDEFIDCCMAEIERK
jgi:hypothetical protein